MVPALLTGTPVNPTLIAFLDRLQLTEFLDTFLEIITRELENIF